MVEEGVVVGVEMADGHRIDCDCVISSAGISNTFKGLLPDNVVGKFGYGDKLPEVKPSFAHLGIYAGLKQTAEELGLPKTNFWYWLLPFSFCLQPVTLLMVG